MPPSHDGRRQVSALQGASGTATLSRTGENTYTGLVPGGTVTMTVTFTASGFNISDDTGCFGTATRQ